ncbi:PxKF domain-containing protein [Deinococcus deserti]|uniref:PxKF domain-containing protein n=1 Tax=Deinococcus deserti TaxID=310783 RepID=UPI0002ED9804|nr:PxKF domain-containing protein [Deinococcus deserti]
MSCTAFDRAGNPATATTSFTVNATPTFAFTGFYSPVDNFPAVNVVKGGAAVPLKFSPGGDQGMAIFAAGHPKVSAVGCASWGAGNLVEETVAASVSGLKYDAASGMYTYVWKTSRVSAKTCPSLTLRFVDGMEKAALFEAGADECQGFG